ncbi:antiviral helicase [Acrasis kona]|uniref:Antiviral helicase n=1 Tax=Acrasis kona TaxID=1008807 RepID=A0AAW2YYX8_9EUKA
MSSRGSYNNNNRGSRGGASRGNSGRGGSRGGNTSNTQHHYKQHTQQPQGPPTEIPEDIVLTLRLVAFIEELYVKLKGQNKYDASDDKKDRPIIKTRGRNQLMHCTQRTKEVDAEQQEKFNKCYRENAGHDVFAFGHYKEVFQEHFGTTCLLCIRNIVNSIAERGNVNIDRSYIKLKHVDNDMDYLLLFRTMIHEIEKALDETPAEDSKVVEKLKDKNEKFYDRLNLKFHSKREIGTWHFLYVCDDVVTEPDTPNLVPQYHALVDDMIEKLTGPEREEHLQRWREELKATYGAPTKEGKDNNQQDEDDLDDVHHDDDQDDEKEQQDEKDESKEQQPKEPVQPQYPGVQVTIKDHEIARNIPKNRDVPEGVDPEKIQRYQERNKKYGELRRAINSDNLQLKRIFTHELKLTIKTADLNQENDLMDTLYHDLKLRDGDVWSVKQKLNDYLKRYPEAAVAVLDDCSALGEIKKMELFEKGFNGMREFIRSRYVVDKKEVGKLAPQGNVGRRKESQAKGETKNMFSALMDVDDE